MNAVTTQALEKSVGKIKGVMHIGAHAGTEIEEYASAGVDTVVWMEANYKVLNRLVKTTAPYGRNQYWYCQYLSDVDNQIQTFYLSNNEESSSTLEFGKHHKDNIPEVFYEGKMYVMTKRLDTLVKEQTDFDWNNINYLVTDCQGCDLNVLKGCGDLLKSPNLKAIQSEVDVKELYRGGSTEEDISSYLKNFGFTLKYYFNADFGWGERYYIRG